VSRFELVSYEAAHRADYLELLREAWGPRALSGEEFDWWFGRNPTGSLMSVAKQDGRVVGVAAHSLFRMAIDGEEQLAAFSVHATTHASARGQGIFGALEERHEHEATERGAACVLAFSSARSDSTFRRLGWTTISRLRMWARPLWRGGNEGRCEFRHDGDAAAAWPNHVVRDASYLDWRYCDSPRRYEVVSRDEGYAVVGRAEKRGVPVAVVADLVGSSRKLLPAALRTAAGCRVAITLAAPEQRAALASLGFVPTPSSLHFMGKALAQPLNTDPAAWRFTLGDTDFF
jgi:GNAT superfamily N-acetyltransferase